MSLYISLPSDHFLHCWSISNHPLTICKCIDRLSTVVVACLFGSSMAFMSAPVSKSSSIVMAAAERSKSLPFLLKPVKVLTSRNFSQSKYNRTNEIAWRNLGWWRGLWSTWIIKYWRSRHRFVLATRGRAEACPRCYACCRRCLGSGAGIRLAWLGNKFY